jgi:hypothetical protein
MSNEDLVSYLTAPILVLLALVYTRFFYSIKRKGYYSHQAYFFVGLAILLSISWPILGYSMGLIKQNFEPDNLVLFLNLIVINPIAVNLAVWTIIPKRINRLSGRRKADFLDSGWFNTLLVLSFVAGLLIPVIEFIFFLILGDKMGNAKFYRLSVPLLAIPFIAFKLRKQIEEPSALEVMNSDPRPPVLYLRAFYQEVEPFTTVSDDEIGHYQETWHNQFLPNNVTLEVYLSGAFSEHIGPLIALGNPEDFFPPEGAARLYSEDADWKEEFMKLGKDSAAIVMELSSSENLEWELDTIFQNNWQQKLFIITKPEPKMRSFLYIFMNAFMSLAKGTPKLNWSKFRSQLRNSGFSLDIEKPKNGAIISFDSFGKGFLYGDNLKDPIDFIGPIKQSLGK